MPQYRYAYDHHNKLVDALSLSRDETHKMDLLSKQCGPFRCAGCDAEVVAKVRGEKKEKHFAHKVRTTCSEETYLHRIAKQMFSDAYHGCLADEKPFHITLTHSVICDNLESYLGRKCPRGTMEKTYDLTQYYTSAVLEKRDGEFVPDLLLTDPTGKNGTVYVEIAVTHFLSERKRTSGARIIEIPVEKEEDLEKICRCHLTGADASFLHFSRYPSRATDADCPCALKMFYCLFIYQNGKSVLETGTLRELDTFFRRKRDTLAYVGLLTEPAAVPTPFSHGDIYKRLLEQARAEGFAARNCLLCRYAGRSFTALSGKPVFCKLKRKECVTNEAVTCDTFLPVKK